MSGARLTLLIKGGTLYDGTGAEPKTADVGVSGDTIEYVGGGTSVSADNIIDASGLAVCPGFIDVHSHSDFTALADPRMEGKLVQGVTTEINGNCGLSAAPLLGDALSQREEDLDSLAIAERWGSFDEYFELLVARGPAINVATLAGHGNVRASVMGYADRPPGAAETERMMALLGECLASGAIGLSTGLIYPPGSYAEADEIIGLARAGGAGGGGKPGRGPFIYASHMRSEGDRLIESIAETIEVGERSGVPVHISHLKTAGAGNWHKAEEAVSAIEAARAGGVSVTVDRYPYTASGTDLDTLLPDWSYEGGAEVQLRRLKEPEARMKIISEIRKPDEYWDTVRISDVALPEGRWMEGMSMAEVARRRGSPPAEALLDVLVEQRLRVGAIFHSMSEDNLRRFLSLPYAMVGSDASARSTDGPTRKGKPHPRGFGTFPRFIGEYATRGPRGATRGHRGGRGAAKGALTPLDALSEAIRKVTSLPSRTFGLKGRGLIKEGFTADIVLFDPDGISDRATYDEPYLRPAGIHSVVVNGVHALKEGSPTGARAGRVLRHGR